MCGLLTKFSLFHGDVDVPISNDGYSCYFIVLISFSSFLSLFSLNNLFFPCNTRFCDSSYLYIFVIVIAFVYLPSATVVLFSIFFSFSLGFKDFILHSYSDRSLRYPASKFNCNYLTLNWKKRYQFCASTLKGKQNILTFIIIFFPKLRSEGLHDAHGKMKT